MICMWLLIGCATEEEVKAEVELFRAVPSRCDVAQYFYGEPPTGDDLTHTQFWITRSCLWRRGGSECETLRESPIGDYSWLLDPFSEQGTYFAHLQSPYDPLHLYETCKLVAGEPMTPVLVVEPTTFIGESPVRAQIHSVRWISDTSVLMWMHAGEETEGKRILCVLGGPTADASSACHEVSEAWDAFCSKVAPGHTDAARQERAACRANNHQSENNKKGWCYERYCN